MINNQKEKHFSYQLEKAINESDLTMPEIIRKTGIQSATF
ncbi:Cro/Cl family transcriptional regulator, partial [Oenococcus oeni IOEB_CiNe]